MGGIRRFFDHMRGDPIPELPNPRPCPFCGSLDARCAEHSRRAVGPPAFTALKAAEQWNARNV